MVFHKNLRTLMSWKGYSVEDLSVAPGVSESEIRRLRKGNGNPTLQVMESLAGAFDVGIGTFFEDEEWMMTRRKRDIGNFSMEVGEEFPTYHAMTPQDLIDKLLSVAKVINKGECSPKERAKLRIALDQVSSAMGESDEEV